MSVSKPTRAPQSIQRSLDEHKPLQRTQQFLVELETTLVLLRKVLIELKELAFVLALIVLFVWGVWELFNKLH